MGCGSSPDCPFRSHLVWPRWSGTSCSGLGPFTLQTWTHPSPSCACLSHTHCFGWKGLWEGALLQGASFWVAGSAFVYSPHLATCPLIYLLPYPILHPTSISSPRAVLSGPDLDRHLGPFCRLARQPLCHQLAHCPVAEVHSLFDGLVPVAGPVAPRALTIIQLIACPDLFGSLSSMAFFCCSDS